MYEDNTRDAESELRRKLRENPQLEKCIIKFQALFRGYCIRRKLKEFVRKNSDKTNESEENRKLLELEYVENYKYPNGAIYTGNIYEHNRPMEKW